MNKKILKASLAAAAAITLAATGVTFAGWSDFVVDSGNSVGADVLELKIDQSDMRQFDDVTLAPGGVRDTAVYVASRGGAGAAPGAKLYVTLQNLQGHENGCDTNGERAADGACNDTAGTGQFIYQSMFYVQAEKVAEPEDCKVIGDMSTRLGNTRLDQANNVRVDVLPGQTLESGQGACIQMQVFMPDSNYQYGLDANNASQGDKATFDLRFDLAQDVQP